ncbi:MAG: SpoIIE family protein phosphatase [Leptospirales bacterium]|nr:SpoIIE family protein phosphatase [Leptospirales bacterium]
MFLSHWLERSFLNFFSIGPLVPTLFAWIVAFFLFRIRNRSRATSLYAWAMLVYGFFEISYFFASTIFRPELAFYRWSTFSMVLVVGYFLISFWMHFPENTHPRFTRITRIVAGIVAAATSLVFFYGTYHAPRIFHFSSHFWDFDADLISRRGGVIILLYVVAIGVLGIWRGIVTKRVRLPAFAMAAGWLLGSVTPGILNVLSRSGQIGYDSYQISKSLMVLGGFFTFFIIYLNNTEDRTTFMTKLVAVSAATFLVVFQLVSYFVLSRYDAIYDGLRRAEARLALLHGDRAPGLRYLSEYDPQSGKSRWVFKEADVEIEPNRFAAELDNTLTVERLARLGSQPTAPAIEAILQAAPAHFAGYAAVIRSHFTSGQSAETPVTTAETSPIVAFLKANSRTVLTRFNKIRELPDENFRRELEAYLQKQQSDRSFGPFAGALLGALPASQLENAALKAEILRYLAPARAVGERSYHWHASQDPNHDPYVAYAFVDERGEHVLEAGFSYLGWRRYMDGPTRDLAILLLATVAVMLVLFPLFFYGALVSPLQGLLRGVQQVNEGDLNVEVTVKVEDEIGFLAQSFNGMVRSIQSARKKLQEYAETLEEKVKERTRELRNTLDEVNRLKVQQDGDYWLTSMLVAPLSSNRAHGEAVKVDFLIKQKKEFQFRRWKSEIGGDFCAADRIQLRGEVYTIFLNADAMGKSIQGAGGTIVLGSVLESILSRTRSSNAAQSYFPERWLKNAFIELHKIFESFDGSMLVSMVFGLIHESSGFLYYINAEHPASVLYRNREAEFLEKGEILRKAGWTGIADTLHIETFQLQPGDVFVAGSDGRDDLAIGRNAEGNRIINEDETQFRIIVQEANADLERIYELLSSAGELTDDLSLVRVEYTGAGLPLEPSDTREVIDTARAAQRNNRQQEALDLLRMRMRMDPPSLRVKREFIASAYRSGAYEEGFAAVDRYLSENPGDAEMIFVGATLARKLKRWDAGIDYGERYRLRRPLDVRNLINLSRLYLGVNQKSRAAQMAREALEVEPDNDRAEQILRALAERSVG